ncbi:MAG: PAS domain S-box protein [Pirellulaceae bacterium]
MESIRVVSSSKANQSSPHPQDFLSAIVESSHDAIVSKTLEGVITSWNAAAERLFGYTAEEAVGQSITMIIPPNRLDEEEAILRRIRGGQRLEHYETVRVRKDGRNVFISLTASPIRDSQGRIVGASKIARDISQQLRDQRALRRSEEQLRMVSNGIPQIVWTARPDGQVDYCNDRWHEYTGLSRNDILGDGWRRAVHADDLKVAVPAWRETVQTGQSYEIEQRLRSADGAYRWFLTRAFPLRDDEGDIVKWFGTCTDVHDQKEAEQALDDSRGRFEAILNSVSDAVIFADTDRKIVLVNPAFTTIFGYTAEETIGRTTRFLYADPQQFEGATAQRYRLNGDESVAPYSVQYRRKDGAVFWAETVGVHVRDSSGKLIGFLGLHRDVSQRLQAEASLRESEERFRTLADNIAQLAWMCDDFCEVTWYNQRWFDYTGTTMEQMQGWGWRDVHHPDHIDRVVREIRRCAESELVWEDTFPLRGKDGTYRWFLSRAVPIRNQQGDVVRWLGTNTDITERREMEEALKEADRRKDEFLALLGHELRNPLAAILNGVRLLPALQDQPEQVEMVRDLVERQSEQMTRLLDDLLDVARITRGKISLRRERLDLVAQVRTVSEDHRASIEDQGCIYNIELHDAPLWIDADATRVAQVIGNLLHNASKFTDPGGTITVRVAAHPHDPVGVVSVHDTGIGIDSNVLRELFEPFLQVETSPQRGHGGLGLGLALVKGLTELHGGTVAAHSPGIGMGSEFAIRLPLAKMQSAAPQANKEQLRNVPAHSLRVLLVEDSAPVARVFALTIKSMGHEPRTAHCGEQALELIADSPPDVVLCDISMPGLSGYDVARRIRENPAWESIYLVAMTGYGQLDDRRQALAAGFDEHLVKPLDLDQLEAIFARIEPPLGD